MKTRTQHETDDTNAVRDEQAFDLIAYANDILNIEQHTNKIEEEYTDGEE